MFKLSKDALPENVSPLFPAPHDFEADSEEGNERPIRKLLGVSRNSSSIPVLTWFKGRELIRPSLSATMAFNKSWERRAELRLIQKTHFTIETRFSFSAPKWVADSGFISQSHYFQIRHDIPGRFAVYLCWGDLISVRATISYVALSVYVARAVMHFSVERHTVVSRCNARAVKHLNKHMLFFSVRVLFAIKRYRYSQCQIFWKFEGRFQVSQIWLLLNRPY